MKKIHAVAILAATAMTMGTAMAVTFSDPVSLDASPSRDSRYWMTVRTTAVPLQWDWQATATSAQLKISGMNSSVVTNFSSVTTDWLWQVSTSEVPSVEEEDLYTLTLTFKNSGGGVVGAVTSRVAVVTGAFGQTPVDPSLTEKAAWHRVARNVVIPYNAAWDEASAAATSSQLVIDKTGGVTQTHALSNADGYFGWNVQNSSWGYGTFDLTLTFPGTAANAWEATLVRMPTATVLGIR